MTTKTYVYGALAPTDGEGFLKEEVFRQRMLWDSFVHNVNAANKRIFDEARKDPRITGVADMISVHTDEIEKLVKERKALRQKSRSKVDTPDLDKAIADLASERKAMYAERRALMKDWYKENKDFMKSVESDRLSKQNLLYSQSECYADNKYRVWKSFCTALSQYRKKYGHKNMRPSDMFRTDGQLFLKTLAPKGLPKEQRRAGAFLEDLEQGRVTNLQMEPVDPRAWDKASASKGERRRLRRTNLFFRADKEGNKVTIPIQIHRPLPEGYQIVNARYVWRTVGRDIKYSLQFVIKNDIEEEITHPSRKAIGIDIGWRQDNGGLLVATAVDSDGFLDWLILPPRWVGGLDLVERLKSHRDEITLKLAMLWHDRVDELPDDLRIPMMGWRPKRSATYVDTDALRRAVQKRVLHTRDTGEPISCHNSFYEWYREFNHLDIWAHNQHTNAMNSRREMYRLFAKHLTDTYSAIVLEDFDLTAVAKVKKAAGEKENPLSQKAKANRQRAALSELRFEIERAAKATGTTIEKVKGASTQTCSECGHKNTKFAGSGEQVFECGHCGAVWNRDINAAQNIIDAYTGDHKERHRKRTSTLKIANMSSTVRLAA